ncbi:MAG: N-6 DNA methylase [Candidatus Caldarchaeum sp.]
MFDETLPSGDTTEDTITAWLREDIEKQGVRIVETQIRLDKPEGGFIKPDIYMENGGRYVIQAKLGDSRKTVEAIGQVWDCVRYGGVDGGFVVVYPEKLRRLPLDMARKFAYKFECEAYAFFGPGDRRPSLYETGGLDKIAKWISEHVLKPPIWVEPNIEAAIRQLRKAADYLVVHFKHLEEKDLEDIFGGHDVFENILQYGEGKYPLEDMRRASAHLLINQILFYHMLSQSDPDKYAELDEESIKHPKELLGYFNKVLDVNYAATFGFDVVSRLTKTAAKELKTVIKNIKALTPEKIKHDLLGLLFHDLIPIEIRKKVAAFYTNIEAAELLANLAIENSGAHVADLAVGSGGLLVAAYRTKQRLIEREGKQFTAKDHKRFVEKELTGIDIMPFAAHLAAINLSLQAPLYETEKVRIAVWDSTSLKPGMIIPSVAQVLKSTYARKTLEDFSEDKKKDEPLPKDAYLKAGVLSKGEIGGEQISLRHVDVVIMNPPFTRQERLPDEYKKKLDDRFMEYKPYSTGQLGLHAYFIFLADRFLKEGGNMALVLPATVLRVRSMLGVRKLLSSRYALDYIITAWRRLAFSEAAWVREILLVARKLKEYEQNTCTLCKIVTLKDLPRNFDEALGLASLIKHVPPAYAGTIYEDDEIVVSTVTKSELDANIENWFQYIATYDPRIFRIWKNIERNYFSKLTKFGSYAQRLNLRVNRGVETRTHGHVPVQAMFVASSEARLPGPSYHWIVDSVHGKNIKAVNRATEQMLEIPSESVVPGLVTYSGVTTMSLQSPLDYIVLREFNGIEDFLPSKMRRRIMGLLPKWRQYVEFRRGNLLICRRYVPSAPGLHHNCLYTDVPTAPPGMMWSVKGGTSEDLKIITLWMNGTVHLAQVLINKVQDVWIDVHEYVLDGFLILDPSKLSEDEKTSLLELFEKVSHVEFPNLADQIRNRFSWRRMIDMELLKILGMNERAIEQELESLYEGLVREFTALKMLAGGQDHSEQEEIER